jgi:hypothetical protein
MTKSCGLKAKQSSVQRMLGLKNEKHHQSLNYKPEGTKP